MLSLLGGLFSELKAGFIVLLFNIVIIRVAATKEDWAKTYVLDTAFGYFIRKNKNILPNWFTEAIRSDLIYYMG